MIHHLALFISHNIYSDHYQSSQFIVLTVFSQLLLKIVNVGKAKRSTLLMADEISEDKLNH